jgi:hypothetical protein
MLRGRHQRRPRTSRSIVSSPPCLRSRRSECTEATTSRQRWTRSCAGPCPPSRSTPSRSSALASTHSDSAPTKMRWPWLGQTGRLGSGTW